MAEKPAYRDPFRFRRCILPMSVYHQANDTDRFAISRSDKAAMGMAGIWEWRKVDCGPVLVTCAMITVPANELISEVHDRMPAILKPADYRTWLATEITNPAEVLPLLTPFDPHQLRLDWVGKKSARANKTTKPTSQSNLFST